MSNVARAVTMVTDSTTTGHGITFIVYKIVSEVVVSRSKASGSRNPDTFHRSIISR